MPEEGWDVNIEYEKLFGSAKRVNLFDSEEDYEELRQFILAQPQEIFNNNELPFNGIEIINVIDKTKHKSDSIKKQIISVILSSIIEKHKAERRSTEVKKDIIEKHFFYIKEEGVCDAMGYYNEDLKFFYICKDSLVSFETDYFYMIHDTENARENFLKKICEKDKGCYRVVRDAKCRSASAAACYVLGREASIDSWMDSEGKHLEDVYPNIFNICHNNNLANTNVIEEKTKRQRVPKFFFIKRDNMGKRSCYAKGTYNKNNKTFTILKDSELTFDVSSSYLYTASDIKRRMIIKKQCLQSKIGFRLVENLVCKDPNEAARYVLGDLVTGWDEWKSKDGLPLGEYTK